MARGTALAMVGATAALVACGAALENSWPGEGAFSGNANASYLDYPESDRSLVASEIDAAADGFALGGGNATVLMNEMTCGVHVNSGTVFFDLDLGIGEVQDGLDVDDSGVGTGPELTSLLVAPPLVTLVPVDHPFQESKFLVRGVREARLLDDAGFIALSALGDESCELRWYVDGHLASSMDLPEATCAGDLGFAVDRDSADAWIATPDGVFAVSSDGVQQLPVEGDLLAWDAASSQLYVGARGSDTVTAWADGKIAWSVQLAGAVVDFDDGGDHGGLVVAHEEGLGYSVDRLDATGAEIDHLGFDRPVLDVAISDRGDLMGIARVNDHAYYNLR